MLLRPLDSALRVHALAITNVDIATVLTAGQTVGGVLLGRDYLVVLTNQDAPAENGVYEVPLAGVAPRHKDFKEFANLAGMAFQVMLGTHAETRWHVESDPTGVLGVDAVVITEDLDISAAADVTFAPAAGIAATNVQDALEELAGDVDAKLPLAGGTVTGLVTFDVSPVVPTPAPSDNSTKAASTAYVDAAISAGLTGLAWKTQVRALSDTDVVIATALEDGDTLDGLTLATGDRVALVGQTAPAENGIYVVPASGAAPRAGDMDADAEFLKAAFLVTAGTHEGTLWTCNNATAPVVGTDAVSIVKIGSGVTIDLITIEVTTLAALNDIANVINTSKVRDKFVSDEVDRMWRSLGSTAGSKWRPFDDQTGNSDITPS